MKTFFKTPKLTTQRLVTLAMLVAIAFVISQFDIRIIPNQLQFTFTFLVNAIIGSIAGPIWGFFSLAVLDLSTIFLSPDAANFLPAWTLMEATTGLLYGLLFYGKELSWTSKKNWIYVSFAITIIMLFSTFIMTPLLLQIYFNYGFVAQYIAGRWLKIFEIPIRIIVTMALLPQLQRIPELRKLMGLSK